MEFTEVSSKGDGFCGWRSHSTVTSLKNETLCGMMRPQNLIGRILQLKIWYQLSTETIKSLLQKDKDKDLELVKLLSCDRPNGENVASRIMDHIFKTSLNTPQQHAGEIRLRAQTVLFLSNRLISFNGKLQTDCDFVPMSVLTTTVFDSISSLLTPDFSEEEYHTALPADTFTAYCQQKSLRDPLEKLLHIGYDKLQLVTIEETWKKKHILRHLNKMRTECPFILISNICTCLEKGRQSEEKTLQKNLPWGVDSKEANNSLWGLEKWAIGNGNSTQDFVDLEHLECGKIIPTILKNRLLILKNRVLSAIGFAIGFAIDDKDLLDILYFWRMIEVTAPAGFDYEKWLTLKTFDEFKTELQRIPDTDTEWSTSPVEKRAAYLEYLFCFKRGSLGNTPCEILTVSLDNNSTGYKSSLKSPQLPFRCKDKYLPSKVLKEMFTDLDADLFTLMSNDESLILSLGEYRNMRKTDRYMTWLGTEMSLAQAATMAQAGGAGSGEKKSDDQVSFLDLTAEKQEEKLWEINAKKLPVGRRCTLHDISHEALKSVHIVSIWLEAYCLRITCRFGGLSTIDCWITQRIRRGRATVQTNVKATIQTNIKASNDAKIKGNPFAFQEFDGRADASRKGTLWSPDEYMIYTLENPNDDAGESLHLLFVNQNHYDLLLNEDQYERFVGDGGDGKGGGGKGGGGSGGGSGGGGSGGGGRGGGGSGGGGRGGGGRGGGGKGGGGSGGGSKRGDNRLSEAQQIQKAIEESLKAEEMRVKVEEIIESFNGL